MPISGPTLNQPSAALYQTHNRHKQPQQRTICYAMLCYAVLVFFFTINEAPMGCK